MQMYNIIVLFEPREFIIFRLERMWKGHGMDVYEHNSTNLSLTR